MFGKKIEEEKKEQDQERIVAMHVYKLDIYTNIIDTIIIHKQRVVGKVGGNLIHSSHNSPRYYSAFRFTVPQRGRHKIIIWGDNNSLSRLVE